MSTHKQIDRICVAAVILSLLLAFLFVNGERLGITPASRAMGYETRLFDTSRVHTLDIVMDGWDDFIETCENESYSACSVVIDNEAYKNVGLRAKGNTSLSTVSAMGSDRYSFKIEFDHYDSGKSYYGLDKLCLNNLIQDNTYMKDYLVYQLMQAFDVDVPLCSFVYITVNGEDWGLYLAVEGVEDGFLQRNYGSGHGSLYKPDSLSFGGGRGNGRDFDMDEFMDRRDMPPDGSNEQTGSGRPGSMEPPEGFGPSDMPDAGQPPDFSGGQDGAPPDISGGFGAGGMGADDVKLKYIDDDPDSYSNIFSSAKTDITEADQTRLIAALKTLSESGAARDAVDIDKVLRYFTVHNFVVNGDSYTGSMVHNYYLYEAEGRLSMIPWDYNLAFGTFQGMDAQSAVNDPIDTPLSVTGSGDRPMIDWIFSGSEYTQLYHQYMAEFLETVDITAIIDEACALIAPYVEKDPTRFCTYDAFEAGVAALKTFCTLRAESVSGQLAGTVPATREEQSENSAALVDASGLTLSDMGTMDMGGGRPGGPTGGFGRREGAVPAGAPQADGTGASAADAGQRPSEESPAADTGEASDMSGRQGGRQFRPDSPEPSAGFPQAGSSPSDEASVPSRSSLLLIGCSVLLLLAGIGAAARYQRRR